MSSFSPDTPLDTKHTKKHTNTSSDTPTKPPSDHRSTFTRFSSFWHGRLVEAGLILSMALYYIVGNPNINIGRFSHINSLINPLYSLPFLLVFAVLCWYHLPFAVALLPLSLPYYLQQKVIANYSHYDFSLAEITLATCLVVALLQMVFQRRRWRYWLSWSEIQDRLGPFALPILTFFLMAALSVLIAYNHVIALRAFREEVVDPLLYLFLALTCLHSRQDVTRLLAALLGSALIIALLGLAQLLFLQNELVREEGVRRVHAVYGSANSIGLLFDYVLPIGLALLVARISLRIRILAAVLCISLVVVLYLTQSRGAWFAIAIAALFVAAFSVRNRKFMIIGGSVVAVVLLIVLLFFRTQVVNLVVEGHTSGHPGHEISTVTKRLYLWQSALHMIHDSPWVGYGMDNWLCHYSNNKVCDAHEFHYWIKTDSVTGVSTGLIDEPTLSHPHNIFLHVWVSMGIFGLLAFIAILILFYWLFSRILRRLNTVEFKEHEHIRWMTVGVGAAMLAALVQGQVDSAFLEQDLAFCFWMLVIALLSLRLLVGVSWRPLQSSSSSPSEAVEVS